MKSEWLFPLSERLSEKEKEMAQAIIYYATMSFILRVQFGQSPDFGTEIERAYEDWKRENAQWHSPPAEEDAQ